MSIKSSFVKNIHILQLCHFEKKQTNEQEHAYFKNGPTPNKSHPDVPDS